MAKNLPCLRNKVIACCVLRGKPEEKRSNMKMVLKGISLAEVDRLFLYEQREQLRCCSGTVFILAKTGKIRVVLWTLHLCEDREELPAVVDCLLNEEKQQLQAVVIDCLRLDEEREELWAVVMDCLLLY
jgi:hypothetical protein